MAAGSDATSGRLTGRRIFLTGAASGIGLATCRRLAAEGARLALLDRDAAGLDPIARELGALPLVADLLDEAAIKLAVVQAAEAMGGIDGVVNVAGIGSLVRIEEVSLEDWNRVMAINLTAPFLIMREALAYLRAATHATVVNVSSGNGLMPSAPGLGAYCASKGGLIAFSRTMALELAPIRVNTICPGVVDTPLLPDSMRQSAARPESPYALKRVGRPEELAEAILFLTSVESSFITGTVMAVDGGRTYH